MNNTTEYRSTGIVAPGQRVRFKNSAVAVGVYDVLAFRNDFAHLRGVQGSPWQGEHWSARVDELELIEPV